MRKIDKVDEIQYEELVLIQSPHTPYSDRKVYVVVDVRRGDRENVIIESLGTDGMIRTLLNDALLDHVDVFILNYNEDPEYFL